MATASSVPTGPEDAETLAGEHLRAAAVAAERVAAEAAGLIVEMANALIAALRSGRKVLLCGNGGSAAQAQHLAAELVGRYLRERRPLPALALTTDTSVLTAIANDARFEEVFARQIDALGSPGDVLIALSTSGSSPDVVVAAQVARAKGITVMALTGQAGGELDRHADLILHVPSATTPIIQEVHLMVGHILCDLVERALIAAPETFGAARLV
ncbi:MAG: SIS domain-containing protein [Chloroflexi bacterium]|nr:SIS domain-containing protein [Chloroflexota bacterium]